MKCQKYLELFDPKYSYDMMRASLDLTFLFPFRVGERFAPGSPERVEGSRDKVEIFGTFLGHSGTNRRAYMVT